MQKQEIKIISRIDGHDRDVNFLNAKLNSTQGKQLELASEIHTHGHGNKQLIDNLASQITKSKNDIKLIEQLNHAQTHKLESLKNEFHAVHLPQRRSILVLNSNSDNKPVLIKHNGE